MLRLDVLLDISIAEFVSWFILTIVLASFLNSVVGQMHHFAPISERKLSWARPQIAFFVPISAHVSVSGSHKSEASDVELPSFVKKRIRYISLNNIGAFLPREQNHSVADYLFDWLQIRTNLDSESSVGVLAWLNYPVCWPFLAFFFVLLISFCKSLKFLIASAFSNMKSDRHVIKYILSYCSVVLS